VNAPGPGSTLRPLGVGEILDRAVNLCVKHIVPLTIIFLVYAIPLAIVQYLATKDVASQDVANLLSMLSKSPAGNNAAPPDIGKELNGWTAATVLMSLFVGPLPQAALVVAAASFYLGRQTSFADAYRAALPRWLHLLGLNFMYGLAGGFLYFVVIIVMALLGLGIGFLYAVSHVAGIAVGIIIGAVFIVLCLGFFMVAILAYEMSFLACVLERQNLAVAFASGIRRVFAGVGLQRSLLTGSAFVAIFIAIAIVSGVGQTLLIALLRSSLAGVAYTTLVGIATAAFTTTFIAIFYFDLRVREEGLDLQIAAQAAQPGTQLSSS
jgi:hypothetical protein